MDEKVADTVHFAFGDSYGSGKTSSRYHTELLVRNPRITVDEEAIMREGFFFLIALQQTTGICAFEIRLAELEESLASGKV